jgi:type VI secretion system protein ImpJ
VKTPQRVVWSEGLLMSPQHLQQLDRYHEELLASRIEALDPLNWGVVNVALDRRALSTGQVQLSELIAVLPDGLVINLVSGSPELPPSRPIEGHFPHSAASVEVHVAVPRERDGISNYSETSGARTRFVIARREVSDLSGGGQEVAVPFGQRNVVLLFGDEPRDDYESLKVAELIRDDGGGLVVCEPYIPPSLRVGASPFLVAGLKRILSVMGNRQRALAAARRQRDASTIEFNASDVTRYLLLNAVNTFLPVMSHMVDTKDISPRHCYLLLCQFAGQLATFSPTEDPATLPKFVYTDLRSTFEELFARITALLQATVKEHYVSLKLDTRDDGVHYGRLEDVELLRSDRFFISIKSERDGREVATQLPRLSKIASWTDINGILQAATPGVPTEVTYQPPPEIPIRAGLTYFTLATKNNDFWRNVMADRTVAIYLPHAIFDPTKTAVELLAIPPGGGGTKA